MNRVTLNRRLGRPVPIINPGTDLAIPAGSKNALPIFSFGMRPECCKGSAQWAEARKKPETKDL